MDFKFYIEHHGAVDLFSREGFNEKEAARAYASGLVSSLEDGDFIKFVEADEFYDKNEYV